MNENIEIFPDNIFIVDNNILNENVLEIF